jgi:hypothetical protein
MPSPQRCDGLPSRKEEERRPVMLINPHEADAPPLKLLQLKFELALLVIVVGITFLLAASGENGGRYPCKPGRASRRS